MPTIASSSEKPARTMDPVFWGNMVLLIAIMLALPASYFFQSSAVRHANSLKDYTTHVLMATPDLFINYWPDDAGSGVVVRISVGVATVVGFLAGLFFAIWRNRRNNKDGSLPPESPDHFKVGSLTYTKAGLFILFFWMLWGDFCYRLMEGIFPAIMPLQLKDLGASNTGLLFLKLQLPAALGLFFAPVIGFKSDRYRSRWGRRIPFIMASAPFICLFLVLLGYSDAIGNYIHSSGIAAHLHMSPVLATLIVVGLLITGFQFFNLFVNTAFWALFADVIPAAYYARFSAVFALISYVATFVFKTYVFPYASSHTKYIYWGAAILYLVGFTILCTQVKEGEYPPPEDVPVRKRQFEGAAIFFRECFTHPFFLALFFFNALWAMSNLANDFKIFYYRDEIHLSMTKIGTIDGIMAVVTAITAYPIGYLIDRTNSLINMLISIILLIPITIAGAYIFNEYGYMIVSLVTVIGTQLWDMSFMPMMLILLPRQRYAKFQGANAMFRNAVNILGPTAAGLTFDHLSNYGKNIAVYRYSFVWQAAFMVPALVMFAYVMAYWVRHGGSKHFVPPDTTPPDTHNGPRAFEVVSPR